MRTVDQEADELASEGRIERLPARVQDALGELAGAAKEGLLALSVGVGLGVLHELLEAEVDEVVGPRGSHIPDRTGGPAPSRTGRRSGTATRTARSRPRAAVSRSAARGPGPLTASARSSWAP